MQTSGNRTKVAIFEHDGNVSRCVCKCDKAIFHDDKSGPNIIDIHVTFFDAIEKITASSTLILSFGPPDDSSWTYSKITITKKTK